MVVSVMTSYLIEDCVVTNAKHLFLKFVCKLFQIKKKMKIIGERKSQ